ncbi:MAG: ATP-binding protein [Ginsengibacter sp.]
MRTDSLKILMLEDNATDAELVQRLLLKQGLNHTFKVSIDKVEYVTALKNFKPDIILSDHSLPEFNSTEALKIGRSLFPKIPFILVTGAASEEFAAEIIKSGADDYILKDRMTRLPSAIKAAVQQRITEKEKLEALELARNQIELAEERERVAMEAANIGIYDYDLGTGALVTSSRCNEIFGFKETRARSEYLALMHPDDIEIRNKAFGQSKITGRLSYELRIIKPDKSIAWIRVEGIVHKNKQGTPERIIGSILDITEFKYLLHQKDNFIAVASHELKTPLTTLKAYTYILKQNFYNKKNDRNEIFIKKMERQINKLSLLVHNLLDSNEIISGELTSNDLYFNIDTAVTEVVTELKLSSDKKIVMELAAPDCKVCADKDKIEQVMINLINNAIKFSPGADKIIVKTRSESNEVVFGVEDFGIGIKDENIKKIFQQFYRDDNDLGYTFPGLGLGLFISSEIVKKARGKIQVKSKKGKGSIFSFSLPCVRT